jgi:hypothetical protein
MYDTKMETTLKGIVTDFLYRNPHVFLHIDVKDEGGTVKTWAIEMSTITNMASRGVYKSTFKPGDEVSVTVNPMKDGGTGGRYLSLTAADGKTYK